MQEEAIVNRVAKSPLVSLDLADYLSSAPVAGIDLKDQLFEGMILREKDFRTFIGTNDWTPYKDRLVHLYCSADAIVPIWAYMLVATQLSEAEMVVFGDKEELEKAVIRQAIQQMVAANEDQIMDGKVVIKGCGAVENKEYAYTAMTLTLLPMVGSLMYGEPCSTVPIYKRRK